MRLLHREHPESSIWLGYCLNVHPGDTLEEILAGIRTITAPLRERLAPGAPFGVGLYLPASVAQEVDRDPEAFAELAGLLAEHQLVAFTGNAFPYGEFHREGLKEQVYAPAWDRAERLAYTTACARILRRLAAAAVRAPRHLSLSTHPGGFGAWVEGPSTLHAYSEGLAQAIGVLRQDAGPGDPPLSLALEAEPRASAGDSRELAEFLVVASTRAERQLRDQVGLDRGPAQEAVRETLGVCLDTCHAAVEFESPDECWRLANLSSPLSKMQLSSALEVTRPGESAAARQALLDLDEPVYLHQATGRLPTGELLRATDLSDLAAGLHEDPRWLDCEAWRCHFHVPVDLTEVEGLSTTRAALDETLRAALASPAAWRRGELHLELETYTWSVLPAGARGPGALVDGIEREYRHALAVLEDAGWTVAP